MNPQDLPKGVRIDVEGKRVICPGGVILTLDDIINVMLEGREKNGWDLEAVFREAGIPKPPNSKNAKE